MLIEDEERIVTVLWLGIKQFSATRLNNYLFTIVVRAFAYGVMGRRIDPSWWTH